MANKPLFTVLMPVYNAGAYLEEAIESILSQTIHDFEFLIINDGSTDDSIEIINKYAVKDTRIRVIDRPNKGFVATLEEGLKHASTAIVARMDADDVSLPNRLEEQYTFLLKNHDYSIVGCQVQIIDEKNIRKHIDPRPSNDHGLKLFLGYGCALSGPTVMFKKEAIDGVGGFDANAWPAEDYDCWTRIIITNPDTKIYLLPDVLYLYRENSQGISLNNKHKQIQKTIEIGDGYRKKILEMRWKHLTYRSYKQWFDDLYKIDDLDAREKLKRIYFITQIWFINDLRKASRSKAFIQKHKLIFYTMIYNNNNKIYLSGIPDAHELPREGGHV